MTKYKLSATLSGHRNTITALKFSCDGKYLATGSEDGTLLIFSTRTWQPVQHYVDASSVTAILWHPTHPNTLVCGFLSGDVLTMPLDEHHVRALCSFQRWPPHIIFQQDTQGDLKFWSDGMNTSITTLAFNGQGNLLAIGHGRTVTLADEIALCMFLRPLTLTPLICHIAIWRNIRQLPDPPAFARLEGTLPAPEVRSLHFMGGGKSLLVSYLDHGVV